MQKILFLIKKSNDHKYYLHFYNKKVGDVNAEVALGVTIYLSYAQLSLQATLTHDGSHHEIQSWEEERLDGRQNLTLGTKAPVKRLVVFQKRAIWKLAETVNVFFSQSYDGVEGVLSNERGWEQGLLCVSTNLLSQRGPLKYPSHWQQPELIWSVKG